MSSTPTLNHIWNAIDLGHKIETGTGDGGCIVLEEGQQGPQVVHVGAVVEKHSLKGNDQSLIGLGCHMRKIRTMGQSHHRQNRVQRDQQTDRRAEQRQRERQVEGVTHTDPQSEKETNRQADRLRGWTESERQTDR